MPDVVEIKIDTSDFERRMQKIAREGEPALGEALFEVGTDIFGDSQRIVPVEFGTLKGSGGMEGPSKVEGKMQVVIFYGGPAADYALIVHENLEAFHQPPTSAKYLEGPFIAHVQNVSLEAGLKIARVFAESGE